MNRGDEEGIEGTERMSYEDGGVVIDYPLLCWMDEGRECTEQCAAFVMKYANEADPWKRCVLLRSCTRASEALVQLLQSIRSNSAPGQADAHTMEPPPEVR